MTQFPRRASARLLAFAVVAALMAGCSSSGGKKDDQDKPEDSPFRRKDIDGNDIMRQKSDRILKLEADKLYAKAREALESADYKSAIERYDQLSSRYPFTDYATQGELERIYAQYRSLAADEASLAADRFLREHPRHPNADYVQYIKGLNDMGRDAGLIDYLPIDSSKRDIGNARRAFDDFALLLQKYPNSRYNGDARERMVFLRNRIALHELSIVRYYMKRGAWVAAAKRAENLIFEFPGAPATADALLALKECYGSLGLNAQADDVGQLIAANAASLEAAAAKPAKAPAATEGQAPAGSAAPERKGVVGAVLKGFDALNKTFTAGGGEQSAQPGSSTLATGQADREIKVTDLKSAGSQPAAKADAAPAASTPAAASDKSFWRSFLDFFSSEHTITLPSAASGSQQGESGGMHLKATMEYPDAEPAKPQADAKPAAAPASAPASAPAAAQ